MIWSICTPVMGSSSGGWSPRPLFTCLVLYHRRQWCWSELSLFNLHSKFSPHGGCFERHVRLCGRSISKGICQRRSLELSLLFWAPIRRVYMCYARRLDSVTTWKQYGESGFDLLIENYTTFQFSLFVPTGVGVLKSESKIGEVYSFGIGKVLNASYVLLLQSPWDR